MSNWVVVADLASVMEAQASSKLRIKGALSGAQANITHSEEWRTPHPLSYMSNPQLEGRSWILGAGTACGSLVPGGQSTQFSAGALLAPLEAGSTPGPAGNELRLSGSHSEAGPTISPCSLGPKEPLLIPKQHLSSWLYSTWPPRKNCVLRVHPVPATPPPRCLFFPSTEHSLTDYFWLLHCGLPLGYKLHRRAPRPVPGSNPVNQAGCLAHSGLLSGLSYLSPIPPPGP